MLAGALITAEEVFRKYAEPLSHRMVQKPSTQGD